MYSDTNPVSPISIVQVPIQELTRENIKGNSIGHIIENEPLHPPQNLKIEGNNGVEPTREYHLLTRGWILNEIVRRVDPQHRTIGEYLEQEISTKHDVDFHIGLNDDKIARVSDLVYWTLPYILLQSLLPRFMSKIYQSFFDFLRWIWAVRSDPYYKIAPKRSPPFLNEVKASNIDSFNLNSTRKGELPSGNGHANARAVAKLASAMANKGSWLMEEKTWDKMHDKVKTNRDALIAGIKTHFSQGGINYFM